MIHLSFSHDISCAQWFLRSQGSQDVPDAEGMPSVCFTFSFPQNMNAKGHKPSEACGDPCSDLCSFILFILVQFLDCYEQHFDMMTCFPWLPSFTCMLSPAPFAFSYVELAPVVLEMHVTYCPLSLLACFVGFSRSHVVPLASGGTIQQKRALKRKIHRSMTIEPPNPARVVSPKLYTTWLE